MVGEEAGAGRVRALAADEESRREARPTLQPHRAPVLAAGRSRRREARLVLRPHRAPVRRAREEQAACVLGLLDGVWPAGRRVRQLPVCCGWPECGHRRLLRGVCCWRLLRGGVPLVWLVCFVACEEVAEEHVEVH